MRHIHAHAAARIHVAQDLQRILRGGEGIFGSVIVDCDLDPVFHDELLELGQSGRRGSADDQRHAGQLRILEFVANVALIVAVEFDITAPNDDQAGIFELLTRFADLVRSGVER